MKWEQFLVWFMYRVLYLWQIQIHSVWALLTALTCCTESCLQGWLLTTPRNLRCSFNNLFLRQIRVHLFAIPGKRKQYLFRCLLKRRVNTLKLCFLILHELKSNACSWQRGASYTGGENSDIFFFRFVWHSFYICSGQTDFPLSNPNLPLGLDLKPLFCVILAKIKSNLVKDLMVKLNVIPAFRLAENPFPRQRLACRHWKFS